VTFQGRGFVEILATEADRRTLESMGYSWESADRDLIPGARQRGREGNLDPEYHTFEEMLSELRALEEAFPGICKVYDAGNALSKTYTWNNYNHQYDLWAVRISDNPSMDEPEPCIVYDARHHAREPMSTEIVLAVARFFCENYGIDPAITQTVNTTEIWCVPMVNPDGHQWVEDVDPNWRKTLHDYNQNHHVDANEGIDANRNYDWHWISGSWSSQTYGGPAPWSAPETASLRDLFIQQRPAINPSFHSYGQQVLYPFGYGVLAEPAVVEVATEYANSIGYSPEPSTTANGSSKDWLYGMMGSASFTVETGTTFIATGAQMLQVVQEVLPASIVLARRLWDASIQGRITDLVTGQPLAATIHIPEIHDVYGGGELHDLPTEAATGYYCHMMPRASRTITLQVSAPDHEPQQVQVTTGGYQATVRDIRLMPLGGTGIVDGQSPRSMRIELANPYRAGSPIALVLPEDTHPERILIVDPQGREVRRLESEPESGINGPGRHSWDGRDEGGRTAAPGLYFVRADTPRGSVARKVVFLQ
jgi:hypothetical protein